jgi:hypothetical protein
LIVSRKSTEGSWGHFWRSRRCGERFRLRRRG